MKNKILKFKGCQYILKRLENIFDFRNKVTNIYVNLTQVSTLNM